MPSRSSRSSSSGASSSSARSGGTSHAYSASPVWRELKKIQEAPFKPEDCLLSNTGMRQTEFRMTRKADELEWEDGSGPDVIYCSPMRRCLLTAIRGFRAHPNTPIKVVPELREKHKPAGSIEEIKAWLKEDATKELFDVPINMSRISFLGETVSTHSQYREEGSFETQGEIDTRRDKVIQILKRDFKKEPELKVAISFHGAMLSEYVKKDNKVPADRNGDHPMYFVKCKRGFPFNFKPYWAVLKTYKLDESKLPVMIPHLPDKTHTRTPIMLLRHAASQENQFTSQHSRKKNKAKREAKAARAEKSLATKRAKAAERDARAKAKTLKSKVKPVSAKVAATAKAPASVAAVFPAWGPVRKRSKKKPKTK